MGRWMDAQMDSRIGGSMDAPVDDMWIGWDRIG